MTPGTLNLTIKRRAKTSMRLTLVEPDTLDPINLTGLSPFRAQVRRKPGSPLLFSFTVADTDLANGILDVSVDLTENTDLRDQRARWDLMDATGEIYVEGVVIIEGAITEPAA